jgi:hypothetical protein
VVIGPFYDIPSTTVLRITPTTIDSLAVAASNRE